MKTYKVKYINHRDSEFLKDNVIFDKDDGFLFLKFLLEDDFYVSIITKEKAKEMIGILNEYIQND